jgi:hypothetical protein
MEAEWHARMQHDLGPGRSKTITTIKSTISQRPRPAAVFVEPPLPLIRHISASRRAWPSYGMGNHLVHEPPSANSPGSSTEVGIR